MLKFLNVIQFTMRRREYDSRFKYFYKENSGLSLTRNYGFSKANGDYIFYIDSDDIISPQTLEFLYKTLKKDNLDLVACYEYDFKDGNTPEIIKYEDVDFRKYLDSIDFLKTLAYEDLILARAWNKLYKRSLIDKVEFEDYVLEDRIFAIDLSLKLFLQIYFFPLWSFLSIKRNHIWIGGRNMRLAKK